MNEFDFWYSTNYGTARRVVKATSLAIAVSKLTSKVLRNLNHCYDASGEFVDEDELRFAKDTELSRR